MRLPIPLGLTCPECHRTFDGAPAKRTYRGYIHAAACSSPTDLTGGAWVMVRGVMRWQRDEEVAVA